MDERLLQDVLRDGENVIWSGQPDPNILFSKGDIFIVPFSLVWGGGALKAITSTLNKQNTEAFEVAFMAFFLFIGFYMVIGRFFYKYWRKKRTLYFITDKRVITVVFGGKKSIDAKNISDIPAINKSIRSDGSGTITFGNSKFSASMMENTGLEFFGSQYSSGVLSFHDIKSAETAFNIVHDLWKKG